MEYLKALLFVITISRMAELGEVLELVDVLAVAHTGGIQGWHTVLPHLMEPAQYYSPHVESRS